MKATPGKCGLCAHPASVHEQRKSLILPLGACRVVDCGCSAYVSTIASSKYHSRKKECRQDHLHDSSKEADRCDELALLEHAGEIADLEQQPKFVITIQGKRICSYSADFRYRDLKRGGAVVTEDVKGWRTPIFRLKKKLTEASYGIEILET